MWCNIHSEVNCTYSTLCMSSVTAVVDQWPKVVRRSRLPVLGGHRDLHCGDLGWGTQRVGQALWHCHPGLSWWCWQKFDVLTMPGASLMKGVQSVFSKEEHFPPPPPTESREGFWRSVQPLHSALSWWLGRKTSLPRLWWMLFPILMNSSRWTWLEWRKCKAVPWRYVWHFSPFTGVGAPVVCYDNTHTACLISQDTRLVAGVAFKKTFSYAGFEMQPKKYSNPTIALLNIELELKAERDNAEIRLESVQVTASVLPKPGPKLCWIFSFFVAQSWCLLVTAVGVPGCGGHWVDHSLRQTGKDSQEWRQGGPVQAANWWCGDAVLCWQVPISPTVGACGARDTATRSTLVTKSKCQCLPSEICSVLVGYRMKISSELCRPVVVPSRQPWPAWNLGFWELVNSSKSNKLVVKGDLPWLYIYICVCVSV